MRYCDDVIDFHVIKKIYELFCDTHSSCFLFICQFQQLTIPYGSMFKKKSVNSPLVHAIMYIVG